MDKHTPLLQEAQDFYNNNRQIARYMFGYPSYYRPLSPLTQQLLLEHYASPFSNNCGDIEERGNYQMDTKSVEKKIVGVYADKLVQRATIAVSLSPFPNIQTGFCTTPPHPTTQWKSMRNVIPIGKFKLLAKT